MISDPPPSTVNAAREQDSPSALFVLGMPDAAWEPLGKIIWSLVGADRAGGVKATGWAELQTLGTAAEPARFVLLVDSPAHAAASAVASGDDLDTALGRWRQAAQKLLRHAQQQAGRCLFVYVPEAWAAPDALRAALAQFGATRSGPVPDWPSAPRRDPVLVALAQTAVSVDAALQRLFAELHASCVVLSDVSPQSQPGAHDVPAAIEHYRRLHADRSVDARRIEMLEQAASRHAWEVEQAAQQHAQAHEQLQARLGTLERDMELLQLQLAQAQEELDTVYGRLSHASKTLPHALLDAHARAMRVLDSAETTPHRHLHVDLLDLRIGSRRWPSLELRLVEHHGRPGIALFATGSAPEVVCAWRTSGRENGRDYMLIVPSDDAGQSVLAGLGSSDWRTVGGCVDVVIDNLRRTEGALALRWASVASRLQAQIELMAPRFRYDEAQAQPESSDAGWLSIRFGEASFGTRCLGNVVLRWHFENGDLRWRAPERDAAVPLASWPADGDGLLRRELALPLGRQTGAGAKRDWWSRLPSGDRELLLGLLDALPAALRHLPEGRLPAGWPALTALRAATELQREARRSLRGLRLRAAARRLLRRGATDGA